MTKLFSQFNCSLFCKSYLYGFCEVNCQQNQTFLWVLQPVCPQNYLESSCPEEAMDNPLAVARYIPLYQIGLVPKIQSQVSSTITAASSSCHCCLWKRTTEQVGLINGLLIPWTTNQRPAQVPRTASADQVSGRRCQGGEDQRQQDEAEGADEEDGWAGRHAEWQAHPHTAVRKSSSKGRGWKVGD